MEHVWIEIKGKNKNSTVLLGVFYQPDFDLSKKTVRIEKFVSVLAAVHLK